MDRADSAPPPVAPRASLRERKRAKVRAAIIQATLDLFAAHGYAHTTIDLIADTAEVSRGTVFNYFCTKEGIILAWACDGHAALAASVDEMIAAGLPPEQILAALWREVRTSHRAHPEASAVLVREVFSPEPERARAARAAWPLHEMAAAVVDAGQRAGAFRDDIPAARLGASIARLCATGSPGDATGAPDAFGDEELAFVLHGVARPVEAGGMHRQGGDSGGQRARSVKQRTA